MGWQELDRPPLRGELNVNLLVGNDDRTYLKRIPKDNPHIIESIAHEYNFIGFTSRSGRFRRRTPEEQFRFTQQAASYGLRVLPAVSIKDNIIYNLFLERFQTLDDFLPKASKEKSQRLTWQLFEDLWTAHTHNIVYGDRWSRNILASPEGGFIHIDFDIEISGPCAREFELAQVAYYTLSGGKDKVISVVAEALKTRPAWFHQETLELFLQQHAIHFQETKYGGVDQEVETVIALLSKP